MDNSKIYTKKPAVSKLLALISLMLVLIMSFSACSDFFEQPTNIIEYDIDPTGYTYSIVCDTGADDTLVPKADDPLGDRLLARYNLIMTELKCNIKTEVMTSNKIGEKIQAGAAIGSKVADLVQTRAETIYKMAKANYLTPLESVPGIDSDSQKWGLAGQRSFLEIDGKSYGFFGLWLSMTFPTVSGVVLYNSDILKTFSVADPYEYYEQNAWTWNSFKTMAKTVTYEAEDGSSIYAFVTPNSTYPELIYAALTSNGVSRYTVDGDGNVKCGYNCYEAIYTLDWLKSMIIDDKISYDMNMAFDTGYLDVLSFTNGRTAFLITNSYSGVSGKSDFPMETFYDKLGWISFPTGPYYQGDTHPSYFSGNDFFNAVATTRTEDLYKGSMILDRIFEPIEEGNPDCWKDIIMDNYFFTQQKCDLYIEMLQQAKDVGLLTLPEYKTQFSEKLAAVVTGQESPSKALIEIEGIVESE